MVSKQPAFDHTVYELSVESAVLIVICHDEIVPGLDAIFNVFDHFFD